ncbi:MAG: class I SAM-dependent methyltransferase [Chloroflexales bacterium]|nr:class I SAM-dependent methyltransferase [Chloroflexales bacterium]
MPTHSAQRDPRLFPPLRHARFYHLTVLRRALEATLPHIAARPGATVVDLGCGNTPYRPLFAPFGTRYVGVDLPGNPQADLFFDANGRAPLPDASADVVVSTQVLEHVSSPEAYLRECVRLLRPGGALILSTHGYWMFHPDPTDFWRWTSSGLRRIIEEQGLQVVQWQGVMGLLPTSLQLLQDSVLRALPFLVRQPFILLMQALIALGDQVQGARGRAADACVFVVVATQPPATTMGDAR